MKHYIICFLLFFAISISAQSHIPQWAKGIVWYQIFPERFANGDKSNDPSAEKVFVNENYLPEGWKVTEWTSNWFAKSDWEKKLGGNVRDHLYERRYGGDIQGVIDNLDYIQSLGVGAIYLNPVFEAVSLHKYDGSSYHHIDVNFGPDPVNDKRIMDSETPDDTSTWRWTSADKLFLKLIDEVHKRGMKIIIDGVFNHTGIQFWAFRDIIKNQSKSKYVNWYKILRFGNPATNNNEFDYKGWWGVKSLPEFNRTENDLNEGPKKYIFQSTRKWMDPNGDGDPSDGIDGWRLDVAREVPLGFWKEWSKLVKDLNPKSIIIGELWELSPDFVSLNGPFDALMNYNFAMAVNDFFINDKTKISASDFIAKLKIIDQNYPEENLYCLQNLISSHDTERLSSMILNPDTGYDKNANEDNPNYNAGKPTKEAYQKQKLIAAFQLFYRGAPMIYYGDEVGMWGADDPHDRKPMVWSDLIYDDELIDSTSGFKTGFGTFEIKQNLNLLKFYKKTIEFRNSYNVFSTGQMSFVYSNDKQKMFAFERKNANIHVICVFNLDNQSNEFKNNEKLVEIFPENKGSCGNNFQIEGNSFKIFKVE